MSRNEAQILHLYNYVKEASKTLYWGLIYIPENSFTLKGVGWWILANIYSHATTATIKS